VVVVLVGVEEVGGVEDEDVEEKTVTNSTVTFGISQKAGPVQ
jgi:hypothetical protein